ncbi:Chitin synthase, class 1 [Lobulomyces angularis]|nr:Chitin synthase, class 1 [Lobulomyces angularis]
MSSRYQPVADPAANNNSDPNAVKRYQLGQLPFQEQGYHQGGKPNTTHEQSLFAPNNHFNSSSQTSSNHSRSPDTRINLPNDYSVEIPVGKGALTGALYTTQREFTHLRYTAATVSPNLEIDDPTVDFSKSYSLRQTEYHRKTKIALVVTMYNENDDLFCKSISAVFKNVAYLCARWGNDAWKNFVLVIVSDGREKCNERVKTVLGCMGVYADVALPERNGKKVAAHLFEYSAQIHYDANLEQVDCQKGFFPVQTIFLLKEKNAKKINSHRWFFRGVCEILNPEVCFLLDVGTKPTIQSFYHLYRAFERDPQVGGACGEIKAELGPYWKNLLNPLVATQNFEYKMSNILDKPLESVFGYISVLPGAFSAYRFEALRGQPLRMYFLGETMEGGADLFKANMYLAEDRILCFELVTKVNSSWVLKYVKSAEAETDVPSELPELISQRRRWLNGSFFAAVHALMHWSYIFRSGHSVGRKFALCAEFFYIFINLIFSWFNVANFYLSFYFLFNVVEVLDNGSPSKKDDPFNGFGDLVFLITRTVYVVLIVTIFIISLGNRPQGSKFIFTFTVIFFAFLMILMLFLAVWSVVIAMREFFNSPIRFVNYFVTVPAFRDVVISLASTWGLYLIASLMHLDAWHVFTCMIQYFLLLPSYVNILTIYSFTNLHDVSWGTKGDNKVEEKLVVVGPKGNLLEKNIDDKLLAIPTTSDEADYYWKSFNEKFQIQKLDRTEKVQKRDAKTKLEDDFKLFRTKVVLFWVLSNGALILIFTSDYIARNVFKKDVKSSSEISPFLIFIFWSVAFLSFIRFTFSSIYLAKWWREKINDSNLVAAKQTV